MKRFRFPQETLLRLKHQHCQQAEMHVWQAQRKLREAEVAHAALVQQLNDSLSAVETSRGTLDAWSWLQANQLLQQAIQQAENDRDAFRKEWQARRNELQQLEAERHALESLRERRWSEHMAVLERHNQIQLDETAMRIWQFRSDAFAEEHDA